MDDESSRFCIINVLLSLIQKKLKNVEKSSCYIFLKKQGKV